MRGSPAAGDPLVGFLRGVWPPEGAPAGAWQDLARRAVAEQLAGVVLSRLEREGLLDRLPPPAWAALQAETGAVRAGQSILFGRFEALASRLHAAGVAFIAHKGAALAPLVYARLEDRPMADIDVLFRPAQWEAVRDALSAGGYGLPEGSLESFWLQNYYNLPVTSPGDPPSHFDMHWSLTQEGRYHVPIEDLFERSVPVSLRGLALRRMADEDLLLSLFLHLAYHYFEARLLWLYDMKRVIESWPIDWDRLLARADAWGLRTVVAFNLAFLGKTFPEVVPEAAARRARPGALRRLMVRPFLSPAPGHLFRREEGRLNQLALGLLSIDRPADAARFAAGKIARSLQWAGRRPRRR